jgi:O-antigen/teichoic acid export membrane protein
VVGVRRFVALKVEETLIAGLAHRALIISITRIINQGLLLISPIALAHLLSIEDFGRYREFLVYVTVITGFTSFGIYSSLLRFVPRNPDNTWLFVSHANKMTVFMTALVLVITPIADWWMGGTLLHGYAVPVYLYVLFYTNIDFWEFLWLAKKRTSAVFIYTTGRLIARLLVVVTTAFLTHNPNAIIWALVVLEAVRFFGSWITWRRLRQPEPDTPPDSWKEQLKFCLPFGGSMVLITMNKQLGNLFVANMMGPVALAHYTIGTYVQPIVVVLRNSLSDVLLPEMSIDAGAGTDPLHLWRRTTVVTTILLLAAAIVLAKFAQTIILTLFSEEYRPAILVFQLYMFVLLRECFDFGVPLRAMNRTSAILIANVISLSLNIVLLLALMPIYGAAGAVLALVIARMIEAVYLAAVLLRAHGMTWRELASWDDLLKTCIAGALASLTLMGSWLDSLGLIGLFVGGAIFLIVYSLLLWMMRITEVVVLGRRLVQMHGALLSRS